MSSSPGLYMDIIEGSLWCFNRASSWISKVLHGEVELALVKSACGVGLHMVPFYKLDNIL